MDACIWMALNTVDSKFKEQIITIFRYLAMIYKNEPITFIETLIKIIENRFSFANDLVGNTASRICFDHLQGSVEQVLARYVSALIENANWSGEKDSFMKLFRLRIRIRNAITKYTRINETLTFCESEFINELNAIGQVLKSVEQTFN